MYYPFAKTFFPAWLLLAVIALLVSSCKRDPEVTTPAPLITSFAPTQAAPGATVVIRGQHFSNKKEENEVKFNGVPAIILTATPEELTVLVPQGVSSGKLTVTIGQQTTSSPESFTASIMAPTIISVTPGKGSPGIVVTLTGKNMSMLAEVLLGTTPITQFEAGRSAELIAFKVPAGAVSGKLVLRQDGQTIEAGAFEVTPVLQPRVWNKQASYPSGSMPRLNIHQGVSFMHGNKIYVGYGFSDLSRLTYSNELTALDLSTAVNTVVHPDGPQAGIPSQRSVATFAQLDGTVYLFGGGNNTEGFNEIWAYDIAANRYTKKATVLPNANHVYNAFVYGGEIYLYIYRTGASGAEIYKYDPQSDALTLYSNFGGLPFWNGFKVEVIGDLAYFIGGSDSRQIKVLDLKNKVRLANLAIANLATPSLMGHFIHFVKEGKIYFGGGWDGINSQAVTHFYVFDPAARVLTQLADIPELAPSYAPPFGVKDGTLHVLTAGGLYSYMP